MLNEKETKMIEALQKKHPVSPWSYDGEKSFKNDYGRIFSDAVNSFSVHSREIAEAVHNTPEGIRNMDALAGCWIKTLEAQAKARNFDGRNQYSVEMGASLSHNTDVQKLVKDKEAYVPYDREGRTGKMGKDYSFAMYVCDHMSREHRTLQQSFSEIIFRYLKLSFPDLSLVDGNDSWDRCPMI